MERSHSSTSLASTATVRIKHGDDEKEFTVDMKILCSSPRFRDELQETPAMKELVLSGHSPAVFQLFLDFCDRPIEPLKYQPNRYSAEPWVTCAAAAWFLATDLGARRFEKYALSQFIQNCAVAARGPWRYIQDNAAEGSSLSRFSNHWVAWNTSFSSGRCDEYVGLDAAKLVGLVTPDTRDPRIYEIDHWYEACGNDLNALCQHNPIYWEQKSRQLSRQLMPPTSKWGATREFKAQCR